MEHQINPAKTGLVVGAFLGAFHLLWAVLVAAGIAQTLIDWVLWMHMMTISWTVNSFDLSAAVTLVLFTAIMGYAFGYCFARIWNQIHQR